MKNVILIFLLLTGLSGASVAQEHNWAFGFYGDVNVKNTRENSFGVQAKYDLDSRSSLQAQVHGRSSFVSVGADYLFSFLDKRKSNFNVFLGAGAAEEFVRFQKPDGEDYVTEKNEDFNVNGQVGLSYYFAPVKLSLYAGYKVKYAVEADTFSPNFITLGVRYHLW